MNSTEEIECPECGGDGTVYCEHYGEDVCPRCDGHGVVSRVIGNEKLTREEINDTTTAC